MLEFTSERKCFFVVTKGKNLITIMRLRKMYEIYVACAIFFIKTYLTYLRYQLENEQSKRDEKSNSYDKPKVLVLTRKFYDKELNAT